MSNQADISTRLVLSNANLQARQSGNSRNSQHSANLLVKDDSQTNAFAHSANVTRHNISKRNSICSADYQNVNLTNQTKLENTFSLGPSDSQKFNSSRTQRLVKDILFNQLANVKYEPTKCRDLVQILSDEIKHRIKLHIYKRYKIIVHLTIGQNTDECLLIASRALWNTDIDNQCTINFKNESIFAVATIFAVYHD
jgi:hypothetical protein